MTTKNEITLDKRVDKSSFIDEEFYLRGILDILQFMFDELRVLLDKEGRFFGIMVSYNNSIDNVYKKLNEGCTMEDCEIFGKILYLFKPQIIKEYRKLEKRRLSKADCMIVLIKRILDFISSECKDSDYYYKKSVKTLDKIITKVYDNIRGTGKEYKADVLISLIRNYKSLGQVGKVELDEFNIQNELKKREELRSTFSGSGTRVEHNGSSKIKEVIWIGE